MTALRLSTGPDRQRRVTARREIHFGRAVNLRWTDAGHVHRLGTGPHRPPRLDEYNNSQRPRIRFGDARRTDSFKNIAVSNDTVHLSDVNLAYMMFMTEADRQIVPRGSLQDRSICCSGR